MKMLDDKKYFKNNGQYLIGFGLITIVACVFALFITPDQIKDAVFLIYGFLIVVSIVFIVVGIIFLKISKKQQ